MFNRQDSISPRLDIPLETHLQRLRYAELDKIRAFLPPRSRILELGGGSGHQAAVLSTWGHSVSSVDIAPPLSGRATFFPVLIYDGMTLPYNDEAFDVVFSSNVLEHVTNLPVLLKEIVRVIKSDGVVVHVLPSPAWRFWTSLTHYVHLARRAGRELFYHHAESNSGSHVSERDKDRGISLKRIFLDGPHGAYPNEFYELYAFSRFRWVRVFTAHGFEMINCFRNGLFYTGYEIFPRLSISRREKLSRFLGSATWTYIMRPKLQRFASS